jgi:hypothetical protein
MKRGTRKYKGKLPFKCLNYGNSCHFAYECPYARCSNSDEEESPKKENKSSIQKAIIPHPIKMMIVTVTQEEYSSWCYRINRKILKIMKKTMNNKEK